MTKYKAVKINGVKHDEHRYIMEQYLGRKLKRNEVVHHKDGNKLNNDINNLELMTLSEHSRMHQVGKKHSEDTKEKYRKQRLGSIAPNRKLSDDEVKYIRNNYKPKDKKFGAKAMQKQFNINHTSFTDIVTMKSYKNIV